MAHYLFHNLYSVLVQNPNFGSNIELALHECNWFTFVTVLSDTFSRIQLLDSARVSGTNCPPLGGVALIPPELSLPQRKKRKEIFIFLSS